MKQVPSIIHRALRRLKPFYWLPVRQRFQILVDRRAWGGVESVSGSGSDFSSTVSIRKGIPRLLSEIKIGSMLDLPCGDFNWMKEIDLKGIDYLGGELLPELVASNSRKFGNDKVRFAVIDLLNDPLPPAELLLCRECLVHLSNRHAKRAFSNIRRSEWKYLLTTTFPDVDSNNDIPTGNWRPLNLNLPPFNLPDPLMTIADSDNQPPGLPEAVLGLWERQAIPRNDR